MTSSAATDHQLANRVHGLRIADQKPNHQDTSKKIDHGAVRERTLEPADFGIATACPEDLKGGDRETNRAIARAILEGARGPRRDIVLVNAAAALVAAGRARNFREGVTLAGAAVDSGAALGKVEELARFGRE